MKKWEINQVAGHYIRSHEEVQRISIRDRLNDFMQAHGAELAAALAPELMNYPGQHSAVQRCAMQHSLDCLREALQVWLAAGEKINYSAQDNDILTAIGFRPDAASRDDSREKFTPAQNLNYTRRRAVVRLKIPENPAIFSHKSHACIGAWFCMRFTDTEFPASASTGAP